MMGGGATGVGSYADTLLQASGAGLVLREAEGDAPGRLGRLLRAARPGARRLLRTDEALIGPPGLFAQAQVHFDLTGRAMPLAVDGPAGIMHWTYPVPLYLQGWRNLYTVHDLIPLSHPALTPIDPRRHRRLLRAILPRATRIVTVSDASRREIVDLLGVDAGRVVDCAQAANPRAGTQRLFPHHGFHLFCGTIEPRKNLATLAEAHGRSGSTRPLVLIGPIGDGALAAALDARPNVILLPYQAPSVLFALMADARALLFPSLAEGFGLPLAEAMMLGTATMTSDRGALAEVAGGAALTVDPGDVDAMASAIRRLDRDDALVADLAERGRARAAAFTMPAYAARLATLYQGLSA
jgi:glycosyltransferase involved in cell wall biosynthesis